jgi:hypothetical protein
MMEIERICYPKQIIELPFVLQLSVAWNCSYEYLYYPFILGITLASQIASSSVPCVNRYSQQTRSPRLPRHYTHSSQGHTGARSICTAALYPDAPFPPCSFITSAEAPLIAVSSCWVAMSVHC